MPTHERLLELQAEAMADDVEIDERMASWSEAQAMAYFESGGAVVPDFAEDIRTGGHSDGRLGSLLRAKLPPLRTREPSMPGEAKGASRKCFVPRPEARVRLFVLYGVADVSMSTEAWIRAAPDWLEVRLVDLPGHGFRSNEPLPECARGEAASLDMAAIHAQRAALVNQITAEIASAAGDAPFALYGFSFGALIMCVPELLSYILRLGIPNVSRLRTDDDVLTTCRVWQVRRLSRARQARQAYAALRVRRGARQVHARATPRRLHP